MLLQAFFQIRSKPYIISVCSVILQNIGVKHLACYLSLLALDGQLTVALAKVSDSTGSRTPITGMKTPCPSR